MSDSLHQLEQQSIYVIREAFARVKPLAMLWSLGKDSNTLLWLVRKAFQGRVPFPVVLLDTGNEFPEVYAFRDRYVREWNLDYINAPCPPVEEADPTLPPNARAAARKTLGLRRLIADRGFDGMLLGIRRDEQAIRGKERAFSPRDANGGWHVRTQPTELWGHYATAVPPGGHLRVHPLLEWTELDIWRYVEREGIPVCELYFARDGKRYRSLGEADITFPVALATRPRSTRSSASSNRRDTRSAPAARWTTSARMPSSGCAPRATCDGAPLAICVAGHVDHGKSSLLGRLLHELSLLPEGKVAALEAASARRGVPLEWSFVLDVFQLERDQAITLDTTRVRVRTPHRELLVIDAPGHRELVRNLVSGAADTSAALLVVDVAVRRGRRRRARTRRFCACSASATSSSRSTRWTRSAGTRRRFATRRDEIAATLAALGAVVHAIVPVSARDGANLAGRAGVSRGGTGPTLVRALEALPAGPAVAVDAPLRLPVQDVYRTGTTRIVAGRIAAGPVVPGHRR